MMVWLIADASQTVRLMMLMADDCTSLTLNIARILIVILTVVVFRQGVSDV